MKISKHVVSIIIALGLTVSSPAYADNVFNNSGNEWLRKCTSPLDPFESGQCFGFVVGVMKGQYSGSTFTWLMSAPLIEKGKFPQFERVSEISCVPPEATIGQVQKIFVKYMSDFPGELHLNGEHLLIKALQIAFPCDK